MVVYSKLAPSKKIPYNMTLRKQIGSNVFRRQPRGVYADKNTPFNYNDYLNKYYTYNAAYQLQNPQSGYNLTTKSGGAAGSGSSSGVEDKGMSPWSTGREYSYPGNPEITGKSTTEISWNLVRGILPGQYEALKTLVDDPKTATVEGKAWYSIDKEYLDSIFPVESQKDFLTSVDILRDQYSSSADKQEAKDNIAYLIVTTNPELGNRIAGADNMGNSITWNDALGNPKEQASWSLYSQDIQFPIYVLLNSEDVVISKYDKDGLSRYYSMLQTGSSFSYRDAQGLLDIYGRVLTEDNLRAIDSNKYYYSNIKEITNMSTALQGKPYELAQHQKILEKLENGAPLNKLDMEFINANSNGVVNYDTFITSKTKSINETNSRILAENTPKTNNQNPPKENSDQKDKSDSDLKDVVTTPDGKALMDVFIQGKASDMLLAERYVGLQYSQNQKREGWLNSSNPLINLIGLANTQVAWNYNPNIALSQFAFSNISEVLDDANVFQTWQDIYYQSRAGGSTGNLILDLSVGYLSGAIDPWLKTGAGVNLALDPENPTVADIGSCIIEAAAGAYIGKVLTYAAKADIPIISKTAQTTIKVSNNIHDFLGRIPVIGRVFSSADDKTVKEFDDFLTTHKVTGQGYDAPGLKVETRAEVNARWGSGNSGKPKGFDAITQKPVSHGRVNLDRTLVFDENKGWVKFNEFTGTPKITDDGTYLKGLNKDGVPKYVNASEYGVKADYTKAGSNSVWDDVKQTFVPKTETPTIPKTDVPNSPKNTTYLENKPPQPKDEQGLVKNILSSTWAFTKTPVGATLAVGTIGLLSGAPSTVAFLAWGACDNIVKDSRLQIYSTLDKGLSPALAVDKIYDTKAAYDKSTGLLGKISDNWVMRNHPANIITRSLFDFDMGFLPQRFSEAYKDLIDGDFERAGSYGYLTKEKDGSWRPSSFPEFQQFWNSKSENEVRALFNDYYGRGGTNYAHFVGNYLSNPDLYNKEVFAENKDGLGNQRYTIDAKGNVTSNTTNTTYKGQGVGTGAGILQPSTGIIPTSATSTNFNDLKKEDLSPQQIALQNELNTAKDINSVMDIAKKNGIDTQFIDTQKDLESVKNQVMLNKVGTDNEKAIWGIDRSKVYAPPVTDRPNYFTKVTQPETIKWDSRYIPQAATYGGQGAFNQQPNYDSAWSENLPTEASDRPWLNEGVDVFTWSNNYTPPTITQDRLDELTREEAQRIEDEMFNPNVNWNFAELVDTIEYNPIDSLKKEKK